MVKYIKEAMNHYIDPTLVSVVVLNEVYRGDG